MGLSSWEEKLNAFNGVFEDLKARALRIYNDHLSGKVKDLQYEILSEDCEKDLADIAVKIKVCRERISEIRNRPCSLNPDPDRLLSFLNGFDGDIEDFSEIDVPALGVVVDKILVHEKEKKHSKTCEQKIEIIFK